MTAVQVMQFIVDTWSRQIGVTFLVEDHQGLLRFGDDVIRGRFRLPDGDLRTVDWSWQRVRNLHEIRAKEVLFDYVAGEMDKVLRAAEEPAKTPETPDEEIVIRLPRDLAGRLIEAIRKGLG